MQGIISPPHRGPCTSRKWLGNVLIGLATLPSCESARDGTTVNHIPADPPCNQCGVSMDSVVTLGYGLSAGNPTTRSRIVRDGRDRYWIGPTTEPGQITVLDANGALLRTLGRVGDGPGEFRGIDDVVLLGGDSVAVIDRHRVTIFGPEFNVVHTFGVIAPIESAAHIVADTIALAYQNRSAPGQSIHFLTHRGVHIRSLGDRVTEHDPILHPTLLASSRRQIFIGVANEYKLGWWHFSGGHKATVHRDADWFPAHFSMEELDSQYDAGGRSRTIQIVALDSTRVWVMIRRLFKSNDEGEPGAGEERARQLSLHEIDQRFDQHIELLDLAANRVLLSSTVERAGGFASPGFLYTLGETPEGLHVYTIWRLHPPTSTK